MGGLILFELCVLAIFAVLLVNEQRSEIEQRTIRRLEFQSSAVAILAGTLMSDGRADRLQQALNQVIDAPSIRAIQITDLAGRTIVSSDPSMNGKEVLGPVETSYLGKVSKPVIFKPTKNTHEAVAPIKTGGKIQGFVWVYPNDAADLAQMDWLLRVTLISALIGIVGCTVLASVIARSLARPLGVLMQATRQLIRDPEDTSSFPLQVSSSNEAADLVVAFNLMVASMQEQRAGLNETLALLDSMLANAPIGFAFFDRKFRFIRVNHFLAQMNELSVGRHLGRTVNEVFSEQAAKRLEQSIDHVFRHGEPVRDLELNGEIGAQEGHMRSWLVNIYPVHTETRMVRWVGAIIVDTTERRRSEDALRKSEKLAAAGRLAASIAHEINNPLEAVTNLLYLIQKEPLTAKASEYVGLAAHELARVSEIAQQTLRFYRQSTLPAKANICELLDSVLALYTGRVHALQVDVKREYDKNTEFFCFAGEMRQLFANLLGNALDSMTPGGGRLILRVRRTSSWKDASQRGIRISVADTGCGIPNATRRRIFEPFYTTKEATGTGLGLWVSAEVIAKHDGWVMVHSRAREEAMDGHPAGTVFTVFFPDNGKGKLI